MGMEGILFNGAEPFEQIFRQIIQAVSEKKTFKDFSFIHVHSPGARADNPWE